MTEKSSDLPPWASKLILAIFVLGVVPVAVYGVYRQVVTAGETLPQIQDTLLTPYAQALAAKDYGKARATYTSAEFQKRTALDAYVAAQRTNLAELGPPKSLEAHVCNETKEPGRAWFLTCDVRYEGQRSGTNLSVDIIENDGTYFIDRTFQRDAALHSRKEQVF